MELSDQVFLSTIFKKLYDLEREAYATRRILAHWAEVRDPRLLDGAVERPNTCEDEHTEEPVLFNNKVGHNADNAGGSNTSTEPGSTCEPVEAPVQVEETYCTLDDMLCEE